MWFALPFGAGCGSCQYLLPEGARLWTAAGVLLLGLASLALGGRARLAARIAAAGCAAGILWFSGYAALYLAPAEALAGRTLVLELELTAGGSDPADAAMLYGYANAALGGLWFPLTTAFRVKDGAARVKLDFDAPGMTVYGTAELSIKIGTAVWTGLRAGWNALFRVLAAKKRLKLKRRQRKAA